MRIITPLRQLANVLSLSGAVAAAAAILLVQGVICLEIVLRAFFATSTFMSDELVGYLIAAIGFLPLGYAFAEGGILRVNLLLDRINGARVRAAVEMACVLATLAVVGLLVWYFYINVARQFSRGYTSGTMSGIPQWIPTGAMLVGLAIFWFQVFVYGIGVGTGTEKILRENQGETAIN